MPYRPDAEIVESDRSILVVALGGEVAGLDRVTGEARWRNKLPGGGLGDVFIAFRYGVLVVSADSKVVYRLDYARGTTMWQATTQSSGRATILIEPDLIVVAKPGYVDAFDHDGRTLWSHSLPGMGHGRVALGFPGNVAQSDERGSSK